MVIATAGKWQAELVVIRRKVPMGKKRKRRWDEDPEVVIRHITTHRVELTRSGSASFSYAVVRRKGCLSFSDSRELHTGIGGTTGIWGTRTPQKTAGKRRSLTPSAWVAEVSRLIGREQAEGIVRILSGHRGEEEERPPPKPPPFQSAEEEAETARMVGYPGGLGSQISREE